MQLKKWWVIIVLSLLCFFFTGGTIYAIQFASQYEAELSSLYTQCELDGWKQSDNNSSLQSIAVSSPSATPKVLEIDAGNNDDLDKLDAFFVEYCKTHSCASPSPTPTAMTSKKPQPTPTQNKGDELVFCYVEKNGSFEMTSTECNELHDANPFEFQVKAYQNCLGGKNNVIGDSGTPESRKQQCSDLTGIVEK